MPTEQKTIRKLRAILSADVKGYSLLMADNELATIATLKSYRQKMTLLIQQHQGRVVDSPGDNMLAEFASAVDAVSCAVKIQEELKERNVELSEDRKMQFRIGINIGDVVQDADRIYGDGVNVAARIEGLAEPGGICISRGVCDHVKKKLKLGFEYLGEHAVKNISEPVRVYKVLTSPEAVGRIIGERKAIPNHGRKFFFAASVMLILGVAAAILWNLYFRPPLTEVASVEKMALPLPDKPSIAVLAFDNLSGDPEQEYFSDGISEEIITALSKTDQLFVIARNSTFTYKGKPVKVKQVAEELGVRYVLEGSIRKTGDRVRITAQLIDAISGHHMWAERYDRDLKDIFAVQDEITMKIVTALQIKLTEGEQARTWANKNRNIDLRFKQMEALSHFRKGTKESLTRYGQLGQEMVDLAPEDSMGYRILAWYNWSLVRRGKSPKESISKAFKLAQKALSLDKSDAYSHGLLGSVYLMMRQHEKAIAAGERSIELDPNGAMLHGLLGLTLSYAGRPDEAIGYLNQGIRLNPFPAYWYFIHLSRCYVLKGQYEDALITTKKALHRSPDNYGNHLYLAIIYALLDRQQEADVAVKKVLETMPSYSLERVSKTSPFKNKADLKLIIDAMRKAGFPEGA
jgi:adenylate cyclase